MNPPPPALPAAPSILTSTVGSYPVPAWLAALPSEEAVRDATRVVFHTQQQAGIDLPTDGELYRFDVNHPDTNGMIDYFIGKMSGIVTGIGRSAAAEFRQKCGMAWRARPAGIVQGEIGEGTLNLLEDCQRTASLAGGPFKFTLTSPYMLARTLLDRSYGDFEVLATAIADVLADQVRDLPCSCLQVDEANVPGNPADAPLAARVINLVLDAFSGTKAVHLCFGNYGGQTIQKGTWKAIVSFLNSLSADHLVLELAHRPAEDLDALADIDPRIALGLGVIDVKINHIESPDEIASSLDRASRRLGPDRIRFIHPDCGFWMLPRSVADRKLHALTAGRNKFLGIS